MINYINSIFESEIITMHTWLKNKAVSQDVAKVLKGFITDGLNEKNMDTLQDMEIPDYIQMTWDFEEDFCKEYFTFIFNIATLFLDGNPYTVEDFIFRFDLNEMSIILYEYVFEIYEMIKALA